VTAIRASVAAEVGDPAHGAATALAYLARVRELPSGTVTLLLTDIEGSTRLLHRLGDRYAETLSDHRRLLRAAFARNEGAEVDTQGDAFFVAFPDALGCVRAAIESQRALAAHAWPEGGAVRVRMGVHTGEPSRTADGYVGMDVHATARICSAGHGGQILLSERTAALVAEALAAQGHPLRDLGEHQLKDIAAPQRLHQIVIPELPSDFPPLRTQATRPNNLPSASTPFIGRAHEVAAVRDLVLRHGVRVVTLTGPGGTGKSRLGLRAASELLHRFTDGVFYVPLGTLRSARLVPSAIAKSLGVREKRGATLVESIAEHLREKDLLLVIDDFERVRAGAREVAELLRACPRLKVLATSREPLRLTAEHELPVAPLGVPERGGKARFLEIARSEAVRLFVDRAEAVRAGFALTPENAPAIAEICRRLDGLPLAIELAAARSRTHAPSQLLAALASRLSVLTDGPIDLPERQQTLRDAIAWSYDLLEPAEKTLFNRLGVFVGGCTRAAAREVCDPSGELVLETSLASLAAKSLISRGFAGGEGPNKVVRGEDEEDALRFVMLDTLREFANEQLGAAREGDALRERHLAWSLALAERAEPELRGKDGSEWLHRLEREHDNLRAALAAALEARNAELPLRFGAALWFFWYQHGHWTEGREWLQRALERGAAAAPRLRAQALYGAADLARHQDQPEEAIGACEDALALYREAEDQGGVARALSQLGYIHQFRGDSEAASAALEQALDGFRALGDLERISFTLVGLGALAQLAGDLACARERYEESLEIGRKLGDRHATATALVNLGEVVALQGDDVRATQCFSESLMLYAELGMQVAIAYCLEQIGGLDIAAGRVERATQLLGAAAALRSEIGAPVQSFNRERYDADLASLRAALGERFDALWTEGGALARSDVVKLALA
jgi:predicted ATPase/class 3 adenylate cyclase